MKLDLLTILELVGIISYAVSGALVAVKKNMDYFGVVFLGVITSVGGGAIRDVTIGRTPPMLFVNPTFVISAFTVSTITFLILYFHVESDIHLKKSHRAERLNFLFDTIGLAAFTMDGTVVGQTAVVNPTVFLTVSLGVTTGIGGGILRDLLAHEMSAVFVKHIYAVAAIAGALVTAVFWNMCGKTVSVILGFAAIVLIRILAAKYRWNMPKVRKGKGKRK